MTRPMFRCACLTRAASPAAAALAVTCTAIAMPPIEISTTFGEVFVSLSADGNAVPDEFSVEEIPLAGIDLDLDGVSLYNAIVTDVTYADGGTTLDVIRVDPQDLLIFDGGSHGLATTTGSPFWSFARQDISAWFQLDVPDHRRVRVTWEQLAQGITGTQVSIRVAGQPWLLEESASSYIVPDENDGTAVLNLPPGAYELLMLSSTQSIVPSFDGNVMQGSADMRVELRSTPLPGPADVDESGAVGLADLLAVLSAWGCTGMTCGMVDVDGDGVVGFADLLAVLTAWGS